MSWNMMKHVSMSKEIMDWICHTLKEACNFTKGIFSGDGKLKIRAQNISIQENLMLKALNGEWILTLNILKATIFNAGWLDIAFKIGEVHSINLSPG